MKTIPNFPHYCISKDGKIWVKARTDSNGRKAGGRYRKNQKRKSGHLFIILYRNGKAYIRSIHRLVLETFVGPCPKGLECRHLNSIPFDNRLSNLQWALRRVNYDDRIKLGSSKGENGGNHKLTEKQVIKIKKLIPALMPLKTAKKIAKMFNVSVHTIKSIKQGKNWGWLN